MKSMNRAAVAVALVTALPFVAQVGAARAAERDEVLEASGAPECSSHTLRGDYGFVIEGTLLVGPAPVRLRGVAMTRFDGNGGLTQVDYATFDGVPMSPDWRPATGTYEVNADCTGRAEIVPVSGPPILLRLVVSDGGRRVDTVVAAGPSTSSTGTRVR
jgi:hypothetical protein